MVIPILFLLSFLFLRMLKREDKTLNIIILIYLGIYILFLVYFWNYVTINLHWELGISGSDMLQYFNVAQYIASGEPSWIIYEYYSNQEIGYLLYIYYLVLSIMWPINLVPEFGVISLYLLNIMLVIFSGYNLYKYLMAKSFKMKTSVIAVAIYFGNISLVFTACRLLRDTLILFLFSVFLRNIVNNRKGISIFLVILSMVVTVILRNYTVLFFIPFLFLERHRYKSFEIYLILAIFVFCFLFIVAESDIQVIRNQHLGYDLTLFDGIIKYLLSPDIIDSIRSLSLPESYFYEYGYNPIIYLILSIWNAIFIPIAFIGLFNNKGKKELKYISLFVIFGFSLIISVLYSGTNEPRHKLIIILPLIILISMGIDNINRIVKKATSRV